MYQVLLNILSFCESIKTKGYVTGSEVDSKISAAIAGIEETDPIFSAVETQIEALSSRASALNA